MRLNQASPLVGSSNPKECKVCLLSLTMEAFNISSPHFREECICKPLHATCSPAEPDAQTPAQLEAENSSSSADESKLRLETTYKKLEGSSKAGCWFCSVLLAGIQDAAESHAGCIEETTRIIASDSPQYSLPLLLSIVSANENLDGFTSYEFYIPRKFYSMGKYLPVDFTSKAPLILSKDMEVSALVSAMPPKSQPLPLRKRVSHSPKSN